MTAEEANIHATALVCGEAGLLLRGRAGAGKSSLALDLISEAGREGLFARLVADDRVLLGRAGGRLVARPHPSIAGLVEVRSLGIERRPFEGRCVVRMLIDLGDDHERLPEKREIEILGIKIYHLAMQHGAIAPARILDALRMLTNAPGLCGRTYTKVI
ncbi:MAG: hypothetical protein K2P80_15815 [Beijerinckiaceae bacterium]|nr:hypothetical protein [Beijerinckiaceae bacterium]